MPSLVVKDRTDVVRLSFEVTPEQRSQIKVAAAQAGVTMREFILRVLAQRGVLNG